MAISTGAAILGAAGVSAVSGIIGGNKAKKAQTQAADASLDLQREMFDRTDQRSREFFDRTEARSQAILDEARANFGPMLGAGTNALAALEYDLGLRQDRPSLTPDIAMPEVQRLPNVFRVGDEVVGSRADARNALAGMVRRPEVQEVQTEFRVGDKTFARRPEAREYLRGELRKQREASGGFGGDIQRALTGSADGVPGGFGGDIRNALAEDGGLRVERIDGGFRVNNQMFATREEADAFANRRMMNNAERRGLGIERVEGGFKVGEDFFDNENQARRVAERRFRNRGGQLYEGYERSPGYEFRLQEGVDAIDASGAAAGNLFSGATLKRLNRFGQDFATNDYANHLQRLFGVAGIGQNAAAGISNAGTGFASNLASVGNSVNNTLASAGANFAAGGGNALTAAGNAQAAGAINTTNAINGFLGNAIGAAGAGNWFGGGGGGGAFAPAPFAVNRTGTGMLF